MATTGPYYAKVSTATSPADVAVTGTTDIAGFGAPARSAIGASQKIRIIGYLVVAAGAVAITFKSSSGGIALTGAMTMATGFQLTASQAYFGWFESIPGSEFYINLSSAVQVSGHILYMVVDT